MTKQELKQQLSSVHDRYIADFNHLVDFFAVIRGELDSLDREWQATEHANAEVLTRADLDRLGSAAINLHTLAKYESFIHRLTVVQCFSTLEAFCRMYLRQLYKWKPSAISEDKTVSLREVAEIPESLSYLQFAITRQTADIHKFFPDNFYSHLSTFGVSVEDNVFPKNIIQQVRDLRHEIVHDYEIDDTASSVPESSFDAEEVKRVINICNVFVSTIHEETETQLGLR